MGIPYFGDSLSSGVVPRLWRCLVFVFCLASEPCWKKERDNPETLRRGCDGAVVGSGDCRWDKIGPEEREDGSEYSGGE
jgi:hypothetical protein